MGPQYSMTSEVNLSTCVKPLQDVFRKILAFWFDHTVICGHRGQADQDKAFADGFSQIKWPDGKHNTLPSRAVDAVPYIRIPGAKGGIHWHHEDEAVREQYFRQMIFFAGVVIATGRAMGHIIRWGGDWDRDWSIMDNRFNDWPHFEYVGPVTEGDKEDDRLCA